MAGIQTEQTALFDFMVVRAPDEVTGPRLRRRYIQDRGRFAPATAGNHTHGYCRPEGLLAVSEIAFIVASKVSTWSGAPGDSAALNELRKAITADAGKLGLSPRLGLHSPPRPGWCKPRFGELEAGAYLMDDGDYYLLPDRLNRLQPPSLFAQLAEASLHLEAVARAPDAQVFDSSALLGRLALTLGRSVVEYVFGPASTTDHWGLVHRKAFDALYLLYIARRWTTVNLEPMITALRALHAIEALAADAVVAMAVRQPKLSNAEQAMVTALATAWPELATWNGKAPLPQFPLIASRSSLREHLTAVPVIHPLFARLFWYGKPFNEVKPIGVGDLKVVRQWLTAYRPGEISHIHNIVKGERRSRDHRRLEKTEEVFSFTDSRSEDTTKDHQSTERFEVKTEAEQVLKTALNVNATANSTFSYGNESTPVKVTASVGAGFAYDRASEDHQKTAHNFAREVVDKAVSRIESRTASTRSTTKLFETEEMNSQVFDNKDGKTHVSGIYRWVDKEYTAQLFNYGKRLMFEFAVPEPAAFWIESRLRAYEAELAVPQPPAMPDYKEVKIDFTATDITELKFKQLQKQYDLGELQYPQQQKMSTVVNREDNSGVFKDPDYKGAGGWFPRSYPATIPGAEGYDVTAVQLAGKMEWWDNRTDVVSAWNLLQVSINGSPAMQMHNNSTQLFSNFWPGAPSPATAPIPIEKDDVTLVLGLQDAKNYTLTIDVQLRIGAALRKWQDKVLETVKDAERKRIHAENQELKLAYESELAEYRNRLAQLDAVTVAEVLQGGPEATNRAVINEEIKKHCLTLMTKEFDTVDTDDLLSKKSAIGTRAFKATSTRFDITEYKPAKPTKWSTAAGFIHPPPVERLYPAIDIQESRTKGKVVQFLEQAFEWELVSYVFYPYFWAEQSRWIELMNRADLTDSTFTAFLRAGMARVLVAVTPGYDDAVLHYLYTREPWDGGPSPVIGDPLFIPLYEEVRQQQDDRLGGVPEGDPWTFTVPTSLVYLHQSSTPLPDLVAEANARQGTKELKAGEGVQNGEVVRR